MIKNICIISTGKYLPEKIVLNDDLPKELNTNDEWIVQRTGIKQRHISNENENVVFMSARAVQECLEKAKISAENINLIIIATTTPNKIFPSCATQVQSTIGAKNAFCFDIQSVCSGFLYLYYTAINMMHGDDKIQNAIIIGAEQMSKILDWNDRSTCVLFGDGAGAVLLSKTENRNRGYIDGILKSDGNICDILYANQNDFLKMDGKKVFLHATSKLKDSILEICSKNGVDMNSIKYFLIHQANARILKYLAESLNISQDKFLMTIDIHANTSAASIPLLINNYEDKFSEGDLVLMAAIGAGMSWGAILLRW
jgi:3-oxoacyl-[acyl-carrier-protein] synthase-3